MEKKLTRSNNRVEHLRSAHSTRQMLRISLAVQPGRSKERLVITRNLSLIFICALAACANPLNRATSDRYSESCASEEKSGNLSAAEEACYRAAANVDWGNLGPEQKSEKLYNLARIKRQTGKLNEAETLLKEALSIEEGLTGATSEKTGRRLAELAAVYYQKKQYTDGISYVERLVPLGTMYVGAEREYVAGLFHYYANEMDTVGNVQVATRLRDARNELGYGLEHFPP